MSKRFPTEVDCDGALLRLLKLGSSKETLFGELLRFILLGGAGFRRSRSRPASLLPACLRCLDGVATTMTSLSMVVCSSEMRFFGTVKARKKFLMSAGIIAISVCQWGTIQTRRAEVQAQRDTRRAVAIVTWILSWQPRQYLCGDLSSHCMLFECLQLKQESNGWISALPFQEPPI